MCGKKPVVISENYLHTVNIYHIIMGAIYGIAVLTCFICNLAVERTLSWFFIVVVGVLMAFSITNLPIMLKKYRLILSAAAVTVLIYLLLFTCNVYSGGDWFWKYAFPIATLPVVIGWIAILTLSIKRMNWFIKSAILSLVCGVITVTMNIWVEYILDGRMLPLSHYFNINSIFSESIYNVLIALCFFAYAFIGILIGIFVMRRSKVVK